MSPKFRKDNADVDDALRQEIADLKAARDAVIVAHNYEPGPVQDLADYVGDSLAMARWAARSPAGVLVVAGVYFMAETAKILSPEKTVLIPDPQAGCSLAESIRPEDLARWKAEHPDAAVVSYVNTSAAVKALSDYCCTSSNAVAVVEAVPREREVLFLPDFYLGSHVARVTGRSNLHVWIGECHVHAAIRDQDLLDTVSAHPGAEVLVHPECGCTTRALLFPPAGIPTRVLSTDGMLQASRTSEANAFVVATEVGLLHRLRRENPGKTFIPANPEAICPYMNRITLAKIRDSLHGLTHRVEVPDPIREKALVPLERMVAIG